MTQILISGAISGAAAALLAIAFQSVYLPTRVFFVGLAGVYSLAPFVAYALIRGGSGWTIALVTAAAVCVGVSLLSEWVNHAPLTRRHASDGAHLVTSLGIYIVIIQLIAMIWGNETKSLRSGIEFTLTFGNIILTYSQVVAGVVSLVALAIFYVWLRHSNLGLQFRALADNPTQLGLLGYNTDRLRWLAFAISGLLASISSLLVSYDVGFDPHIGLSSFLLAVVATIIGGRRSFVGPALASVFLGILRATVAWFFSAMWQDAAVFALLVFFLFLRPQGVFGRRLRLESQS
jgi:branched-chain amino acid transport system permease protein